MDIKKTDYAYLGRYKTPLLYAWLLQNWVQNDLAGQYGLPKLDGRIAFLDGHLFFYASDWKKIKELTRTAVIKKDGAFFESVFKLTANMTAEMLQSSRRFARTGGVPSEAFASYFRAMNRMEYPWIFVLPMNEAMEELAREAIAREGLPENALQSFFSPARPTPLMRQKREALQLHQEMERGQILGEITGMSEVKAVQYVKKHHQSIYERIVQHVEQYHWFGMMHMWGEPFSKEKLLAQIRSLSPTDDTIANPGDAVPESLKWLVKQSRELSYWRNYVAEVCAMASYEALKKLEEASQKMGLMYALAGWLSPAEFLRGLGGGAIPSHKEIKERKQAYGLVAPRGKKVSILTGAELTNMVATLLGDVPHDREIRGTVANSGRAVGIVKVVFSPDDIGKVEKGDIMVASETTPDFVPAVYRAAALVADVGGITSYAAVISREFGIPCIVGTKHATRVLKDGDRVEVDAERGIITKIL